MRKTILLIIAISFLPFIFVLTRSDFFYTQDGWTHLVRAAEYFKGLRDGQLPVRWAGSLNYSYGMPLPNFTFQIPYILMTVFISLGTGLVNSLKLITLLSYLLSGIFMFLFSSEFFKDKNKALFVTVFYQFFPYRLVDMFVRGSVGEMYTFAFLPMILYGIVLVFKKISLSAIFAIVLGTAGIIMSHLATGGALLLLPIVFTLLFSPSFRRTVFVAFTMIWGLSLSAYYLLPALYEHKYTYGSLFAKDLYKEHFAPLVNFFLPNFFNDPKLRMGDVPIQMGIFHVLAIFAAVIFIFQNKKKAQKDVKLIIFCLVFIIISFFIMQPVSLFVWQKVPLFEQFQFPWRFLGMVGFASSLLSVYILSFLKKKKIQISVIVLVIFATAYYWYPQLGFRKVDERKYWNSPETTTYFGETNLIWSGSPASSYPKKPVEVIQGKAVISQFYKKSNLHSFKVKADSSAVIVDHTQFYPGWNVLVDGEKPPVQFQDPAYRGEMTFPIEMGDHQVTVKFGETIFRKVADGISFLSLSALLLLLLINKNVLPKKSK